MNRKLITAILLLLASVAPFVAAADRFYIDPTDVELGTTETIHFNLDNSQDYYGFQAEVKLPAGLVAQTDSDGELDITLSERADGGNFQVNSNVLPDGSLIMGAYSTRHAAFTGTAGTLVCLKVSVAESFKGGSIEISNVFFINNQDEDVELSSTSSEIGVKVSGISLSETEMTLTEGETKTLTATITPDCASDKSVTWTSSDSGIATVSAEGVVTAVKAGSATITATSADGKTATCVVTVTLPGTEVSDITLDKYQLSLPEGETAMLTATVAPAYAEDKTVTWTSSHPAVATVSADGEVTAVKAGSAVITATTANGKTAKCIVTVLPIMAETLTIDPTIWNGVEGSEFKITATVLPENTSDKSLSFESNDPTVATVDEEGNVKVLKNGSCVITVSTTDGSFLTAKCVITGTSGVETIFGKDNSVDVYGMNGALLKRGCERDCLKNLTPGIYLLRSGDSTEKVVIR